MRNMGEACTAANRFLVHESVAGEFTAKLAARIGALSVGRGTEAGGGVVEGEGYFYQPTVLANVPNDAAILKQEIFGPVAPVTTFTTRTTPSGSPTPPNTASPPTCTRGTSRACCG